MSLAVMLTAGFAPSVSNAVIASEYGSSPVEAALHHTRIVLPWCDFWCSRIASASSGKWCSSR